jgi:hypothetical protein
VLHLELYTVVNLQLAIQDPASEPQMLRDGFIVRPNNEIVVGIKAKLMTASEKMQEMDAVKMQSFTKLILSNLIYKYNK